MSAPRPGEISSSPCRSRAYSPYADRDFPTRPFFGDTHLHTSFSMDAGAFGARLGAARRLPLRPRRAGHFQHRPAGEAVASARLPRGRRSLRQHGLLSRSVRRQARAPRRSDRPQMVRHDQVRQGRGRRDRDHRRVLARDLPEGPDVSSRNARLSQRVAGDDRGRRALQRAGPLHRLHRLRVDFEHRRQQPASQCHLPRQWRQGEPGRAVHASIRRSAATIRSSCGSGWTPTKRRPAAACWPSRTTAI